MKEVTLETERLRLRMFREETDFEDYAAICADPEVMRYMAVKTFNRMETWRHLAFLIGHWHMRGYGHWAVEEKSTGRLVGRVGFLNPEGWPDFEIGWTLGREHWGKGYASEAGRRALDYAFEELGRERVISLIHPENRNSIRVAERLGETRQGETHLGGFDLLIYGIDRAAWLEGKMMNDE